jgi:hypothetical protein
MTGIHPDIERAVNMHKTACAATLLAAGGGAPSRALDIIYRSRIAFAGSNEPAADATGR